MGALAHLLREEGLTFEQPREDRTEVVAVAVVDLIVSAAEEEPPDRTLDAMIEAAVARFEKRFGDGVASIQRSHDESHR